MALPASFTTRQHNGQGSDNLDWHRQHFQQEVENRGQVAIRPDHWDSLWWRSSL